MKKTLFIIGLSAIFMAGCQNGEMQERERQLQDSFASVMSAKNAEMEAFFQQLNEIETSLKPDETTVMQDREPKKKKSPIFKIFLALLV